MSAALRSRTIRLAYTNPALRPHLIPLLTDRVAMEFETQDALDAYLKDHPGADKSKHTVKSKGKSKTKEVAESVVEHAKHVVFDDFHEAWEKSKETFDKIVDKVDAATSSGRKFRKGLEGASEAVKTFIASPRYRRKKTQQLGGVIKSNAKKIAHQIAHAVEAEIEEVKDGLKSFKQVLTKGSPPLTKKQKKAMYSTGAYVAGAAVTAVGGGALAVATKVGSAFAIHVAIKAISHMADSFFTHFEWGAEASHVVHAVGHIASSRRAADEDDDYNDAIIEALVRAVGKVLSDGLSDKDIESMLAGEGDAAYDDGADIPALEKLKAKGEKQKSSDKEAALRSRVIRLAHTRTDLRPHLVPLLVTTE